MEKPLSVLMSACLCGVPCRYDGKENECAAFSTLLRMGVNIVPVCPEVSGGLPTPRTPSERKGDRVITKSDEDVSEAFQKGAEEAVRLYFEKGCCFAVLKERSPSCGVGKIYDGSFSGRTCDGNGVTAEALLSRGIRIFGESETDGIIEFAKSKLNP